jgi:hypothetical protein
MQKRQKPVRAIIRGLSLCHLAGNGLRGLGSDPGAGQAIAGEGLDFGQAQCFIHARSSCAAAKFGQCSIFVLG